MVRDVLVDRLDGGEPPLLDQRGEQLGVVHDLVVPAELWVLVGEGVEAVRAGGDDLQRRRAGNGLERLDVLHAEHLEEELVSEPARRVAGAGFRRPQHRELDARDVQQLGERPGHLPRPVLERPGTADPVQVLDVGVQLLAGHGAAHWEIKRVEPVLAATFG